MKYRLSTLFVLFLLIAPAAYAQEAAVTQPEQPGPTLQQQLMPEAAAAILAPVVTEAPRSVDAEADVASALQRRGSGAGLMIAGGALFIAGLLVGNDAGTVLAVAGAAIGAYGLYIYFN